MFNDTVVQLLPRSPRKCSSCSSKEPLARVAQSPICKKCLTAPTWQSVGVGKRHCRLLACATLMPLTPTPPTAKRMRPWRAKTGERRGSGLTAQTGPQGHGPMR